MKSLFKQSKRLVLGSLLAIPLAVAVGCGSSSSNPGGPGSPGGAGGGQAGGMGGTMLGGGGAAGSTGAGGGMAGAGGGGPIELSDFVNDLILNKTASNTVPVTINDKTFTDSMNPAAFSSLFP